MSSQHEEGLLAVILKPLKLERLAFLRLALIYYMDEIVGQHERHSLPSDTELLFEVTQDMTKVHVKQLAVLLHHDIVRVAIGDTENVSCDAITGTAQREFLDGFVQRRFRVVMVF